MEFKDWLVVAILYAGKFRIVIIFANLFHVTGFFFELAPPQRRDCSLPPATQIRKSSEAGKFHLKRIVGYMWDSG